MSLSKREKMLILIGLMFATLSLYYFFFLQPHMNAMDDLNKEIADKDTELKSIQQMHLSGAALEKRITEDLEIINQLSGGISKGNDQPPLIVFLENSIGPHATKGTFLFDKVHQSGHLFVAPVTITVTGSYSGLKNILSTFANQKYFIKITGLSISYNAKNAEFTDNEDADEVLIKASDKLDIKINAEVYSLASEIPSDTVYEFIKDFRPQPNIFG